MARRRLGFGRGPRQKFEQDELTLLGGVRHGRTLGSPVAIEIKNSEWFRSDKWHEEMSPAPGVTKQPLTQVRPGHADLVGMQKYGFTDARDVLERASARETAARVAAGAVVKKLLGPSSACRSCRTSSRWEACDRRRSSVRRIADLDRVDESPVRCFDSAAEAAMIDEVKAAAKDGDSLGGVVEVLGYGMPIGLGSHVHWDRKIDAALAQAVMSIQAVKGVEIGDGFEGAGRRGSAAHDAIVWDDDDGRVPPRDGSGRRHGGWHDDRRAAGGARRDEAAGDPQPADVEDGRRRHQGIDRQLQGAHRRHGGSGDGSRRRDHGRTGRRRRGATQVRRRLVGRVRSQRRVVSQLARLAVVGVAADQHSGARRVDGIGQDHRRAHRR